MKRRPSEFIAELGEMSRLDFACFLLAAAGLAIYLFATGGGQ